jgi:hypothetical protein
MTETAAIGSSETFERKDEKTKVREYKRKWKPYGGSIYIRDGVQVTTGFGKQTWGWIYVLIYSFIFIVRSSRSGWRNSISIEKIEMEEIVFHLGRSIFSAFVQGYF